MRHKNYTILNHFIYFWEMSGRYYRKTFANHPLWTKNDPWKICLLEGARLLKLRCDVFPVSTLTVSDLMGHVVHWLNSRSRRSLVQNWILPERHSFRIIHNAKDNNEWQSDNRARAIWNL